MFTIPAPYKHIITYTKVHGNDKNRGAVEGNLWLVDS